MFPCIWLHFKKFSRKIFSGVWKRRRKTQNQKNTSHNLEKNHQQRQIQSDYRAVDRNPRSRSRSRLLREIAINGAISRSVDRDLGSSSLAYIRDLAIDVSRDRAVNRDLDPASRDRNQRRNLYLHEIAIDSTILRSVDRDLGSRSSDWSSRDRRGLELGVRQRSSD